MGSGAGGRHPVFWADQKAAPAAAHLVLLAAPEAGAGLASFAVPLGPLLSSGLKTFSGPIETFHQGRPEFLWPLMKRKQRSWTGLGGTRTVIGRSWEDSLGEGGDFASAEGHQRPAQMMVHPEPEIDDPCQPGQRSERGHVGCGLRRPKRGQGPMGSGQEGEVRTLGEAAFPWGREGRGIMTQGPGGRA